MSKQVVITAVIGILIRLFLFNILSLKEWLETRVEISTPLTSWNRVLEGIFLRKNLNISPYESDLIHEIPIMLKFYSILTSILSNNGLINLFFILIDVLNGVLLYKISEKILSFLELLEINEFKSGKCELFKIKYVDNRTKEELDREKEVMLKKSARFLISSLNNTYLSLITLVFYCLSPYTIVNCLAKSTSVINNFLLCAWLALLLSDRVGLSMIFLALISHNSLYPIMLIVPTLLYVWHTTIKGSKEINVLKYLFYYIGYMVAIFIINYNLEDGNLKFIKSTYLFILNVPDLQPNLGLFWYFFTEIFDHFRQFFTWIFQLNTFIYFIPLTIRLRNNPIILIYILIGLMSVLKSYPCLGDAALYISLLPTFKYLFKFMRNLLIYSCMFIISTILAPIMWHLWIHTGSGNANFYFAITLVYSVSQIFFLTDLLYAYLKREYIKFKGDEIPLLDDKKSLADFRIE